MPTILTIFGTRPEAIKMAPVVKAIEEEPSLTGVVCVTAQQPEMLDQVLVHGDTTTTMAASLAALGFLELLQQFAGRIARWRVLTSLIQLIPHYKLAG